LEFLAAYDLDILYTLGKASVVADVLCRNVVLALLEVKPTLLERIKGKKRENSFILEIIQSIEEGQSSSFKIYNHNVLRMKGRLSVPNVDNLKR